MLGMERVLHGYVVVWPHSSSPMVTYPTHNWRSKGDA